MEPAEAGFRQRRSSRTKVSLVIANAAECEPLLHKDKELLHHHSEPFLRGLSIAMELVGAPEGVIGIKEKYHDIIEALEQQAPPGVRVVPLPDGYPAGDEFILVHMVTGRVIPPGGLPKDVDAVVSNVETLMNIGLDRPVTHKYLTVAGAVENPVTLRVPVGITIGEVIEAAGGATVGDIGVLLGGVMMAKPAASLDVPVTKTTGGIIVLPASHNLIQRHNAPMIQVNRIGRSACDQCRFCTEFCPRFLLGHPIEPHRGHAVAGFCDRRGRHGGDALLLRVQSVLDVCLPGGSRSEDVCVQAKPLARERGLTFKGDPASITPHPMAEFRRVPMRRLIASWAWASSTIRGRWWITLFRRARSTVLLKQHAGVPAVAMVKCGDRVRMGDLLAAPEQGKLGARIHASIDGVVTVTRDAVVIEA